MPEPELSDIYLRQYVARMDELIKKIENDLVALRAAAIDVLIQYDEASVYDPLGTLEDAIERLRKVVRS